MSFYRTGKAFRGDNGYDIEGTWYPRITRIVSIKAKPALYRYYAAAQNFATAESHKERSAEEGTRVHNAIEAILKGEAPLPDLDIRPSILAFENFLEENDIIVIPEHIERRVVHPEHRYAGTIDAIAYVNGRFGVLDVKTSQDIYRDYALQTAAYLGALKADPTLKNAETRWILRIDQLQLCDHCGAMRRTKGGREKIRRNSFPMCRPNEHRWGETRGVAELKEFSDFRSDFDAFLAAKRLWEWENETWLKQVGYL